MTEPPPVPYAYPPDHPDASTVLVLGVIGLVVCNVVAPFAWVRGRRVLREIDAAQGGLGGRGSVQAGYVLGIVGTCLMGVVLLGGLLVLVVWLVFVVVFSTATF
jgi:hypothetical protein